VWAGGLTGAVRPPTFPEDPSSYRKCLLSRSVIDVAGGREGRDTRHYAGSHYTVVLPDKGVLVLC
jgi:hypothetical protein